MQKAIAIAERDVSILGDIPKYASSGFRIAIKKNAVMKAPIESSKKSFLGAAINRATIFCIICFPLAIFQPSISLSFLRELISVNKYLINNKLFFSYFFSFEFTVFPCFDELGPCQWVEYILWSDLTSIIKTLCFLSHKIIGIFSTVHSHTFT